MTSGQNGNEFTDARINLDVSGTTASPPNINFMMQELPKDYSGATIHFEGKNNEKVEIRIGGVNCGQLKKILDILEGIKFIIGEKEGQKVDFPQPHPVYPFYPQYPYTYPTNPFEPTITWCNNSSDDTNKAIRDYIRDQTVAILKTNEINNKMQSMVNKCILDHMNQDQVIKSASHLDEDIHDVEITEDEDTKRIIYDED